MAEVRARGVTFHVQQLGDGEPAVVFLHGLVMDNLSSWYFTVANRVAKDARAVLYDLRGHGRSERPPDGYRVEDMVEDLRSLLDALGLERPVTLVGNSFGGLLAVSFAVTHPGRVGGVVLVDGHLSGAGWGDAMADTLSLEGEERDRKIAESFKEWLGRHSERKRNRLAESARALVEGTTLVADMRAATPLTDAQLASVRCPVLAIYGQRSDILGHGERFARLSPHVTLDVVPGCSHSVLWEHTEGLRERIHAWVLEGRG